MISQHQFNSLCDSFNEQYKKSKKDINLIESLSVGDKKEVEAEIGKNPNIACGKGCVHCCYLRVVAYPHEIIAIHKFLHSKVSESSRKDIVGRISKAFDVISKMTVDEHLTTNVECPFLIDKTCSVYPVRPLACAGYHSVDVEPCIKSYNNPTVIEEGGIPQVLNVTTVQSIRNTVIKAVAEAHRDDTEQYELIRALKKLQDNPKAIQRWRNGSKMFK